jgi:hypothetical protein
MTSDPMSPLSMGMPVGSCKSRFDASLARTLKTPTPKFKLGFQAKSRFHRTLRMAAAFPSSIKLIRINALRALWPDPVSQKTASEEPVPNGRNPWVSETKPLSRAPRAVGQHLHSRSASRGETPTE